MSHERIAIYWFRKDLRLTDNPALYELSKLKIKILPIYIFDRNVGSNYPKDSASEWWLCNSLQTLDAPIRVYEGDAIEILRTLKEKYHVSHIFCNKVYETKELELEEKMRTLGCEFYAAHSQTLFRPGEVVNASGGMFRVYTPFRNKCLSMMPNIEVLPKVQCDWFLNGYEPYSFDAAPFFWAKKFRDYWEIGEDAAHRKLEDFLKNKLAKYKTDRDYPSVDATSKLSPHLHFGEISAMQVLAALSKCAQGDGYACFLNELIWREFAYYLLGQFPNIDKENIRKEFNGWEWENNEVHFEKWKKGETGIPIVDAGMRELWRTGYMHNRVRMIVASFLTKHLLIDWRWGADYFMETLVDADVANNYVSWQWVAGTGVDAAPYFRIFNPNLQAKKFDRDGAYIRRYVKSGATPIIDLEYGRKRALERYKLLG